MNNTTTTTTIISAAQHQLLAQRDTASTSSATTEDSQSLSLYQFQTGHSVRSFKTANGEPWFIAADICGILGVKNTSDAVSRLDREEKGLVLNDTKGGTQSLLTVNESGLYALILSSRKLAAKPFLKWFTSVVLPSIRQNGGYINGQETLAPSGLNQMLEAITKLHEVVSEARLEIRGDRVARSKASRLMR